MPRLSLEDAQLAHSAIEYALAALKPGAPEYADWQRVCLRLRQRLNVACSSRANRRRQPTERGATTELALQDGQTR